MIKEYFKKPQIIIGGLFFLVLILCGNNFSVYESYKNAYKEIETLTSDNSKIVYENRVVRDELEGLKIENELLRRNYYDLASRNEELSREKEELKGENHSLSLKNKDLMSINEAMLSVNKELTIDNIALQNSLKMAASVGVKPQNYTIFEGLDPNSILAKGQIEKGTYIGEFLGTAYTPCAEECGNNMGITNSGQPIIPGISIAVDTNYWPFGTIFYIKGLGYTIAMDTGNMVKGKNRFDFAVFNREFAGILGIRKWDVYLVKMGKGTVGDKNFSFLY